MKKTIATYIFAYKNSSISVFTKPLEIYLKTLNITLGDINYYMTCYDKDKSIIGTQLKELLTDIKDTKELILIKNIFPSDSELKQIIRTCKKHNCKIITISKNGELLGVI